MAKKKDYIKEFAEQQSKASMPWEYTTKGKPTPFQEARGNTKLLAISCTILSVLLVITAIGIPVLLCSTYGRGHKRIDGELVPFTTFRFEFDAKEFFPAFFSLSPIAALSIMATVGYWRRYRQQLAQKKQYKAQRAQLGKKKRKKKG